MRKNGRVGITILLLVVAAIVVALSPMGDDSNAIVASNDAVSAPGTAGMKAYLDPETGELTIGPSPSSEVELDAETQNALRRDDEGLKVVRHDDGSSSMDLQGRFQSVSIIRIDENGKAVICATDVENAERGLNEKNVPATPEVK